MSMEGWIGVDLDGTLAEYHGWDGTGNIGKPIPAMVARVKGWLKEGIEVRIFTARLWPLTTIHPDCDLTEFEGSLFMKAEAAQQAVKIREWCREHLGEVLSITTQKDYQMVELWDDRAVRVEINTGRRLP